MSSVAMTNAICVSQCHEKIELKNLHAAIGVLKVHPNLPANQLRPLLLNSLPYMQSIDAHFLRNFQMKVALYMHLAKQSRVTIDNAKILEDPLICLNFKTMYENILQGD